MRIARIGILLAALLVIPASLSFGGDGQAGPKLRGEKQTVEAARKTRVRLGTITVGGFYSHYSGPPFYRYPYYYGYRPFFWDPLWWPYYAPLYHPGFFTGFAHAEDKGEVKLQAEPKTAEVFLDGAYAGTADGLKNIWLGPGAYNLELRAENRAPFQRRIYVLTRKTLKITATLGPAKPPVEPEAKP